MPSERGRARQAPARNQQLSFLQTWLGHGVLVLAVVCMFVVAMVLHMHRLDKALRTVSLRSGRGGLDVHNLTTNSRGSGSNSLPAKLWRRRRKHSSLWRSWTQPPTFAPFDRTKRLRQHQQVWDIQRITRREERNGGEISSAQTEQFRQCAAQHRPLAFSAKTSEARQEKAGGRAESVQGKGTTPIRVAVALSGGSFRQGLHQNKV